MFKTTIISVALILCSSMIFANEYYFTLQSGHTIKIKTPDNVSLEQAISEAIQVGVSLISNTLEQHLDSSIGESIIINSMPEVLGLYQQQSTLVYSQPMILQQQLVTVVQMPQSSNAMLHSASASVATLTKANKFRKLTDSTGKNMYPCAFPGCDAMFTNVHARCTHHKKEHVDASILQALDKGISTQCPYCATHFKAYSSFISHIAKHRK